MLVEKVTTSTTTADQLNHARLGMKWWMQGFKSRFPPDVETLMKLSWDYKEKTVDECYYGYNRNAHDKDAVRFYTLMKALSRQLCLRMVQLHELHKKRCPDSTH
jgi:hypothetical protein